MTNHDKEIAALKESIDRLIRLLEREAGIMVRLEPSGHIERLLAQVEQLSNALDAVSAKLETESETDFRQMMDRPEVGLDDRNTQGDPTDEDDAARV